MKPPEDMTRIIGRQRYSTKTAEMIASDCYWDGHNWERQGRNTFLYRTPKGNYFTVRLTCWQDERNTLIPIDLDEAIELFENNLTEHEVSYEKAFPNVTVEEA